MTVAMSFPTELTPEVLERLGAPVPANEISTKKQGGTEISFTSDKFVMRRLDDVVGVGGWQDDYQIVNYAKPVTKVVGSGDRKRETAIVGSVICRLKVLGVMKSATVDMEYDPNMYGTPATNAQARAFKRAAMKFGIAAELWDKERGADDEDEQPARTAKPASSQKSGSGSGSGQSRQYDGPGKPTEKQSKLLGDLGVPASVVAKLTGGREGTASAVITSLLTAKRENEDYEDDPRQYIAESLRSVKLGKLAAALAEDDGDDEDEDED